MKKNVVYSIRPVFIFSISTKPFYAFLCQGVIYIKEFNISSRLRVSDILSAVDDCNTDHVCASCDCWEMLYVSHGKLEITVENMVFELSQGTIACFPPEEFHCIRETRNAAYMLIAFRATGAALSSLAGVTHILSAEEESLIKHIRNGIHSTKDALLCQQLYAALELLLLLCCAKEKQTPTTVGKDATLFSKAGALLQQHIQEQPSVAELADMLDISLSHLKRLFARYALIGVHEYFTALKISYAKTLLKGGESVTRTAMLAGFSNQAYFSAAFKRITGISPKEFSGGPAASLLPKKQMPKTKLQTQAAELPSYLL